MFVGLTCESVISGVWLCALLRVKEKKIAKKCQWVSEWIYRKGWMNVTWVNVTMIRFAKNKKKIKKIKKKTTLVHKFLRILRSAKSSKLQSSIMTSKVSHQAHSAPLCDIRLQRLSPIVSIVCPYTKMSRFWNIYLCSLLWVAFSSLAKILGECSPALFLFFLKWRLARAH